VRVDELETSIECLDAPPAIHDVSMLDGYLPAVIVWLCSIDPLEWLHHMLRLHWQFGTEGRYSLQLFNRH